MRIFEPSKIAACKTVDPMEKPPLPRPHSTPAPLLQPCWECIHEGDHPKGWGPVCKREDRIMVVGQRRYGCAHWEPIPWPPMPGNGAAGD